MIKEMVPRPKAELKKIFNERAEIEVKKLAEASEKVMKANERLLLEAK